MEWRAFELHPGIPPEGTPIPWPPERIAAGRAAFVRLAEEAGLEVGERTHWYDSTPAHEATAWVSDQLRPDSAAAPGTANGAQETAQDGTVENGAVEGDTIEDAFRRAVFRAYFVDGRNIADPEVLAALAAPLGLDAADLRAALRDGRYRPQVRAQYDEAHAIGVTGVPTFVVGRYGVVGAQPYEALRDFVHQQALARLDGADEDGGPRSTEGAPPEE